MTTNNSDFQKNANKSKNIKLFLAAAIFLVLVIGAWFIFYTNATNIYVDNPTETPLSFKISDWEEYSLAAYTWMEVKLKTWNNKLFVNWAEVWSFDRKSVWPKSFLNPTEDVYVQEYLVYGDLEKWRDSLPNGKVTAYDNDLEWPFKQLEWIYITWDWDYWLNEDFPDEITIPEWKSFVVKSKVYRFDDFVDMYNVEYYNWEDETDTSEEDIDITDWETEITNTWNIDDSVWTGETN